MNESSDEVFLSDEPVMVLVDLVKGLSQLLLLLSAAVEYLLIDLVAEVDCFVRMAGEVLHQRAN